MELIPYSKADFNKLYNMFKCLPDKEWDFVNKVYDKSIEEFKAIYIDYINEEFDSKNPTKRFVVVNNDEYIGYIGIRLSKNVEWLKSGSQLLYQIIPSKRGMGYANNMVKLALLEMKKMGFKEARVNCDNENIASKKTILKNGGLVDINKQNYKSSTGISSSYIINLRNI